MNAAPAPVPSWPKRASAARPGRAFGAVPRDTFLGRGPWQILRWGRGHVPTPSADPRHLYADLVVAIRPQDRIDRNHGRVSAGGGAAGRRWAWGGSLGLRVRRDASFDKLGMRANLRASKISPQPEPVEGRGMGLQRG